MNEHEYFIKRKRTVSQHMSKNRKHRCIQEDRSLKGEGQKVLQECETQH